MSRALNTDASLDHVVATCARLDITFTCMETLPGGYTRVVLQSGDDATIVGRAYGAKVIKTPVTRRPLSLATRSAELANTSYQSVAQSKHQFLARR